MMRLFTMRWIPGPAWVHFLLFGIVLFLVRGVLFPEPPPVLGPPDSVRLQLLYDNYARMAGKIPSEADIERFVDLELRDELLFREAIRSGLHLADSAVAQRLIRNMMFLDPENPSTDAARVERGLALNMHLTDEVIRRRLVQMMEQILIASAQVPSPTQEAIALAYQANPDDYQAPATVSFQHVFFGEVTINEARLRLDTIRSESMTPAEALQLGTAFLGGYNVDDLSWTAVTSRFGKAFSADLRDRVANGAISGQWLGPVKSVFGLHAVFLERVVAERTKALSEVADEIAWDLQQQANDEALEAAVENLMARYQVLRR